MYTNMELILELVQPQLTISQFWHNSKQFIDGKLMLYSIIHMYQYTLLCIIMVTMLT